MTIYKKLFRDLLENKGANIAAIAVIAIAIMLFNGSSKTMDDLYISKDVFYKHCSFPDVYAQVISAPIKLNKSLYNISGIKNIEGRITEDVKILNTNKTLRLISTTKHLGTYTILKGRHPDDNKNEILIDNNFAAANQLQIGDSLSIISKGNICTLKICGIARSAENIFPMKDETTIFSDPKEFGISFVDLNIMKSITGDNHFDEILFSLEKNVSFEDVKTKISKQLEIYGLIRLYEQVDQSSNIVVDGEIRELKTTMIFMPSIFLFVAGLVMSIMIKRIIAQQRGQIGVLKAFGYSDFSVGLHYSSYLIVIGLIGGILGSIFGMFFANIFLNLYKTMFNMEFISKFTPTTYFIKGILLSTIFCVLTGIWASQKALSIQPAEAMRQEAPPSGQKSIIENYRLFHWIFNSKGKMAIRNIVRNRKRSLFIIIGLSLAFAISVLPLNMLTMLDDMIFNRFKYVEKYDAKIVTNSLLSKDEVQRELSKYQGVKQCETMIDIPVKLKHNGIIKDVSVIGIKQDSNLYSIIDDQNNPIKINPSGISLSERLADKLQVNVGDSIIFKSPYSKYKKEDTVLKVDTIVPQTIGMNGYMDIDFLSKTLRYNPVCNNILIKISSQDVISNINEDYEDADKVKVIQSKQEAMQQIQERMKTMRSAMYFMIFISVIMGFSIIYNIYLVVILERQREFSTLMVLGMSDKEVLSIISLEQWFCAALAMLIGAPIAKSFIYMLSKGLSTDMFTMPADVKIQAILMAVLLMIFSISMAKLLASRKIHTIDIVDALKSGE